MYYHQIGKCSNAFCIPIAHLCVLTIQLVAKWAVDVSTVCASQFLPEFELLVFMFV